MQSSQPHLHPCRALTLVLVTGVLLWSAWAGCGRAVRGLAAGVIAGTAPAGFADLVEGAAALTVVACTGWLCLAAVLVCLDAVRGTAPAPPDRSQLLRPGWMRRVVVMGGGAALGVGLVASPAPASPAPHAPSSVSAPIAPGPAAAAPLPAAPLMGLTVPDRPTGAFLRDRTADPVRYTVADGDSLWLIASRFLPRRSGAVDVAAACRLLHDANRDRIGPDIDLIRPGTTLLVPMPLSPGKDRP